VSVALKVLLQLANRDIRQLTDIEPPPVRPALLPEVMSGRRDRDAVHVVPQALQCAAVAPGTGPRVGSYGMDAAFMSFQPHGSGNHAVRILVS
jgi:hypothetical protein